MSKATGYIPLPMRTDRTSSDITFDREQLIARASSYDALKLSPLEVRRLSRSMRGLAGEPEVRIAFAGNVVLDPLTEFTEAHLACAGLTASSYVTAFGQPLQALLDEKSALHTFSPNFLFLHFDYEALSSSAPSFGSFTPEQFHSELEDVLNRIEPVVRAALDNTAATILLTNFVGPDCYALGLADARSELSEQEFFSQLNSALAKAFRGEARVQVVDLCRLTAFHGRGRTRDRRLYYVAKLPWHESFLPVLADELVRHVYATMGRIRKCLVVDLDNTLWGGILGEDGPLGVRVGPGDPVGEAHFDLQRRILSLKGRGILLAACSKNNPSDVDELFRVRDDMPLRREDFTCMAVGWAMKNDGLRHIAEQLNIGSDSLVFLDDNPAEIELIRQLMPEVLCVLVPADPALRPTCLDRVHGLDRAVITSEDQDKTLQYQQNAVRDSTRARFGSVEEYLYSLETRIAIGVASAELMARAHQLFAKTNQFNVTTRRYSVAELERFADASDCRLMMIHATDRFGDIGWVGTVLLTGLNQPCPHIDSFILSCRAMGRGIETAVLNHVKRWCFTEHSYEAVTAEYLPTAKNMPVCNLFGENGFQITHTEPDGRQTYRLVAGAAHDEACDWIACELIEELRTEAAMMQA